MPLKEAHDIGEELQKKIEDLPEVERVCLFLNLFFLDSAFLIRHLFILIMIMIIIHQSNIKLFKTNS